MTNDIAPDQPNPSSPRRGVLRLSVRGKLLTAFGAVAVLTIAAIGLSLFAFGRLGSSFEQLADRDLPKFADSADLAVQTTELMIAANSVVNAESHEARDEGLTRLQTAVGRLGEMGDRLAAADPGNETIARLQHTTKAFTAEIASLDRHTADRIDQTALRKGNLNTVFSISEAMTAILSPKIDDAYFELMIGGEDAAGQSTAIVDQIVNRDMTIVSKLLALRVEINALNAAISNYLIVDETSKAQIFADKLVAHSRRITDLLAEFEADGYELAVAGDIALLAEFAGEARLMRQVPTFDAAAAASQQLIFELIDLQQTIDNGLVTAVDDQMFELTINAEDAAGRNTKIINDLMQGQVGALKANLESVARLNHYVAVLIKGALEADATRIVPIQDQVTAAANALAESIESVASEDLKAHLDALVAFADPASGLLAQRTTELVSLHQAAAVADTVFGASRTIGEAVRTLIVANRDLVRANSAAINREIAIDRMLLIAIGAFTLIAVALISFLMVDRNLARPLAAMRGTIRELADGNTAIDVAYDDRGDEIGDIARAVTVFRDNAIERARLAEAANADQSSQLARQTEIDALIAAFRSEARDALVSVTDNAEQMRQAAAALSEVAETTSGQAGHATASSDEASANVQAVASAAEQLAASVEEIGRQIRSADGIVERANAQALETDSKISGLAEAAERIGHVVGLISDIAEKTNLLALNATIEAARAGESGRGFAVVASEVKSLATQTARATEDIGAQIGAIQSSTGEAVAAVRQISETMTEVREYTTAATSAVSEQGSATAEISRNAALAAEGTARSASAISEVQGGATRTTASAEQMLTGSDAVNQQAVQLRETVDRFLDKVAAA